MENNVRHVKTENKESGIVALNRVIDVLFGLVEIVLAFRLVFKMLGANPGNGFVNAIYAVTEPLTGLFEGIFDNIGLGGQDPERVFEPGTLIAMIVIAIIAWIVHSLIFSRIRHRTEQTEYIAQDNQNNTQPPRDNTQPPQGNNQPRQDNTQPPQNNNQPRQDNTQPPQNNNQPRQDNTQPPQNNNQPRQDNTQPQQDNTQPPRDNN